MARPRELPGVPRRARRADPSASDASSAGQCSSATRTVAQPGYITKRGFPKYQNSRGLPRGRVRRLRQPGLLPGLVDAGAAADAAIRLLRAHLDLALVDLRRVAGRGPGSVHRAVRHATTGEPVLVVGERLDPATRYEGALIAHGLLPNSALLTVDSWGHTSLFMSACADAAIADYLIDARRRRRGRSATRTSCPSRAASVPSHVVDPARALAERDRLADRGAGPRGRRRTRCRLLVAAVADAVAARDAPLHPYRDGRNFDPGASTSGVRVSRRELLAHSPGADPEADGSARVRLPESVIACVSCGATISEA